MGRFVVAFRLVAAAVSVVLGVHGVALGISAIDFWQPCFAQGYDSESCQYLQYEAPAPWFFIAGPWLWLIEMAAVIGVLLLARRSTRAVAPAAAAAAILAVANPVTDYLSGPIFNGGYTSADAAPGVGYLSALALVSAAILLALTAVRPVAPAPPVVAQATVRVSGS